MELKPNEKIESWDIICTTTDGRKISYCLDMGYDLDDYVCQTIDDNIVAKYPVSGIDETED